MTEPHQPNKQGRSSSRRRQRKSTSPKRNVNYRQLKNPFPPMQVFPAEQIADIHNAALKVLEELGIKVLHPEAQRLFGRAGARLDASNDMVYIGRDIVKSALQTPPKSIHCKAGSTKRDLTLELGSLCFQPGGGAPNAIDNERGRRPGSARDFEELIKITQHFDVLQMISPFVEPQDVQPQLRHYFTTEKQLICSDKFPFVFARGTAQVKDCFAMLQCFRGLSTEEFQQQPHCYTIINTNSPRTLDLSMAQGLIDFARHGQLSIVTPFTLMGAMAPITVAGAITLSHAEALAAITLTQLVKPGAPVCYGTFTSNVDMRSGSPAFGTSAHFQASLAAGQLARYLGLPWRCAAGSASTSNDAQAANENQFGLWGCLLAGATVIIHSAGWLEGGLAVSYEQLITDLEVLNMVAEVCQGANAGNDEIGFDNALSEILPSGHFFASTQTMERYSTEFYQPIVHDYTNHGTWKEAGAKNASDRATMLWKQLLASYEPPEPTTANIDELHVFIEQRTREGGAPPVS